MNRCGDDLSSGKTDDQVSNERVFGFSRTMGDHGAPAGGLGQIVRCNRFGHGSDLIHFQKETVARFALNAHGNAFWVSHRQIITDNLSDKIYIIKISPFS